MPPQPQMQMSPPEEPEKKKSNLWRNLIILFAVLVILGGIIYLYVQIAHPEWLSGSGADPNVEGESKPFDWTFILWIGIIGAVILVGYVIFNAISKSSKRGDDVSHKKPVSPDKAEMLWKEHFSIKTGIKCVFDRDEKIMKPANPDAITIHDKLPYYHTATGDSFWLIEVEVIEGKQQGIHTVVIPIDRGEDTIKGGYYRIDTHTPKFQFNLYRNTFPMSSMVEKQDRLRLAMMEKLEDEGGDSIQQQQVQQQLQSLQQPIISTPLDTFGEGEGAFPSPPYSQQPYRRPYTRRYRRPTYRRGYR